MRVLVTGAAGFIGSNLIPVLHEAGHTVFGLDNFFNPSERYRERMQWEISRGDVTNYDSLYDILSNRKIEAVVHLAAHGSVPRSFANPYDSVRVNDLGFVNLLVAMKALGIERLVYASSSSVYGDNNRQVKVEGEEGKPLSPYALTKKTNEEFARIWAPQANINAVGLRFFNVYGPGQRPHSQYSAVIPRFITQTPTLYGDGSKTRDFTFVGDVARAISLALDYTAKGSATLNVGTGTGTNLKQLLSLLSKTAKQMPERLGDVNYSIASTMLCESTIGFKAKVQIAEGLEITKAFYDGLFHE
ncbi:WcaG Nucleoside-diphosphate-sugar epimerases [uncultured Caudovirales phage]|uniref:WcaG Nucleoside-diphosphate-sugar epimerases n=1 Tax=uncultured Caudovirales phage TaxID=2100421 RepID=A0A6J5PD06_9CAUD|nr:WcaG Nucleoside-diphosphate-sugar epimerases [uncultured Caudovirales phage]CAB4197782.1 WcaG Nucleoside-diphosphate-sugar epimerases [uncultured Caudovirales phage]CAB4210344.1 WcaG Nucleoside-diphosphate-sugar epimerases [uncultured Caudovirales phage]